MGRFPECGKDISAFVIDMPEVCGDLLDGVVEAN
jgi:hypothetical protein